MFCFVKLGVQRGGEIHTRRLVGLMVVGDGAVASLVE